MELTDAYKAPPIDPVPEGTHRPRWSVMIPTYNCAYYLRQTLESVLAQAPGPDEMQIEVVDDCSTKDDPRSVVEEIGQGRVEIYVKPQNEGVVANFNTCIQRSRGHLVHILHGDDYVLPGFYAKLEAAADAHPDIALFASRSFIVTEEGHIIHVMPRIPSLETGSRDFNSILYTNGFTTPSVVMRREFYETHGGFLSALVHTADWEMWGRAVYFGGGYLTPEVLACWRSFKASDSSQLKQTAENLRDCERLFHLLEQRYGDSFNMKMARKELSMRAIAQVKDFRRMDNRQAANANLKFWRSVTPLHGQLLEAMKEVYQFMQGTAG